ncbi:MAG: helix-turn-helix domain-containing protein [Candidatus Promineofilum sp.]|nr:helix-turn-helix domain-containing protein [Promineifilum sp.]
MKSSGHTLTKTLAIDSSSALQQLAAIVAENVSELLHTDVMVLDEQRIIIAGPFQLIGQPFQLAHCSKSQDAIFVPFNLNGEAGEVVVCELASGEAISPRLARILVEMVINEATTGNRPSAQTESRNKLIFDLLCGRVEDEDAIFEQATRLGLDLLPPQAVLLIDASDYIMPACVSRNHRADVQAQHRAQYVIRAVVNYFRLPSDLTCAYVGHGEIAVLKAADANSLADWAEADGDNKSPSWADLSALKRAARGLLDHLPGAGSRAYHLSIGRFHRGLKGLARSYEDARAALALGRRFNRDQRVHCLDELSIYAFVGVSDHMTKVDLALHLLSPLYEEPELLETLNVFFAVDSCPSQAAGKLCIHRNTVAYRLGRIASLTGLDPRRFDEAVQLRLALILRTMSGASVA